LPKESSFTFSPTGLTNLYPESRRYEDLASLLFYENNEKDSRKPLTMNYIGHLSERSKNSKI